MKKEVWISTGEGERERWYKRDLKTTTITKKNEQTETVRNNKETLDAKCKNQKKENNSCHTTSSTTRHQTPSQLNQSLLNNGLLRHVLRRRREAFLRTKVVVAGIVGHLRPRSLRWLLLLLLLQSLRRARGELLRHLLVLRCRVGPVGSGRGLRLGRLLLRSLLLRRLLLNGS